MPPAQALPEPAIGASQAIGAGAAAGVTGAAAGTAAGVAATAPGVALLKAGQESIEAILQSLSAFFVLQRAREQRWQVQAAAKSPVAPTQLDVLNLVADEGDRAAEYQRKALLRVTRKLRIKDQITDPQIRRAAFDGILQQERVYARMRSEAMARRALSMVDRVVLRDMPKPAGAPYRGAYWHLSPHVKKHTPDCLAMGGKWWPWEALAIIFPPTHAGCPCSLRSWNEALALGWRPGRFPSIPEAVLLARRAKAMLHEGVE